MLEMVQLESKVEHVTSHINFTHLWIQIYCSRKHHKIYKFLRDIVFKASLRKLNENIRDC